MDFEVGWCIAGLFFRRNIFWLRMRSLGWEVFIVHSWENKDSSIENLFHKVWSFVVGCPFSPWICMNWQNLLQHQISYLEILRTNLLVKCSLQPLWYNWLWQCVVMRFSSIMLSWSILVWTHSTYSSLSSAKILLEGISTSMGRTTFMPYTRENGVAPVEVRTEVRLPCKAKGSISCLSLYVFTIFNNLLNFFHYYQESLPFKYQGLMVEMNPRLSSTWEPLVSLITRQLHS